jgi:cephalosporin-C deacetylase
LNKEKFGYCYFCKHLKKEVLILSQKKKYTPYYQLFKITLMKKFAILLYIGLLGINNIIAQPSEKRIKVIVAPEKEDWTYKIGQPVKFNVMVLHNGVLLQKAPIKYTVGPEKLKPSIVDSTILPKGTFQINGGTMNTEGFLRCIVTTNFEGREYKSMATAAFEPEKIKPVVENPADFNKFWNDAKAELAKIPIDARLTLLPDRCTEKVNVYHLNLQNFKNYGTSRLYGILCVPKKEGKYPAILRVPGAGIRPYYGDVRTAESGVITLEIGIHGVPVTMAPEVYPDMMNGCVNQYWTYNLDDRDTYYFKRVYLGCVRANDYLVSLPEFDGKNLAVAGGSQGGALAIVTAALDNRVKFTAPTYPAMADMAGYLKGRAGGWPHIFDKNVYPNNITPDKIKTASYYDVVNFARLLTVPTFYSMGYNDDICPPTSMYAAYNVISAPKTLKLYLETGHWTYPEEQEEINKWLLDKLGVKW